VRSRNRVVSGENTVKGKVGPALLAPVLSLWLARGWGNAGACFYPYSPLCIVGRLTERVASNIKVIRKKGIFLVSGFFSGGCCNGAHNLDSVNRAVFK